MRGPFFLAIRYIRREKIKAFSTVFAVFFSAFLIAQQLGVFRGLTYAMAGIIRSSDADIWVATKGVRAIEQASEVPTSLLAVLASDVDVESVAPLVVKGAGASLGSGRNQALVIVGTEAPHYLGAPRALPREDRILLLSSFGNMLLDRSDRGKFDNIEPGETFEVNGQRMTMVKWLQPGDAKSFGGLPAHTNIETARALTGSTADKANYLLAKAKPGADLDQLRDRLAASFPEQTVMTTEQFTQMAVNYNTFETGIGASIGSLIVVAVITGLVSVCLTLYASVSDKITEFASLKAIGVSNADLRNMLLIQVSLLAFAGLMISNILVFIFGKGVRASGLMFSFSPFAMSIQAVATLLCCWGASFVAIRRVLKLDPAAVLRT